MKASLLLALVLALPSWQIAQADNHNRRGGHQAATNESEQAPPARRSTTRSAPRVNHFNPPARGSAATRRTPTAVRSGSVQTGQRGRPQAGNHTSVGARRTYQNRSSGRQLGTSNLSRNGDRVRGSNTAAPGNGAIRTNRTHRGNRNFDRNSFNVARNRGVHTRHDRGWWRSHYHTTFVLFGGGYYYWDTGYWYPAYGYDPYYNNYAYDEPIYGYNDLAPGQVLENVQLALRDEGYYNGAIDGLIGPQTRAALAAYQRDHGLVITEAVDEPTLVTLGLA